MANESKNTQGKGNDNFEQERWKTFGRGYADMTDDEIEADLQRRYKPYVPKKK